MSALDGDVKIPGAGEVPKKKALIIGGAVVAAVLVILVIRGRSAASATGASGANAAGASGADSSGTDAAGYPVGSPEDQAWQAQQDGGVSGYGGLGYGSYGTPVDAGGYPIGSAQDLAYQQQTATGITTNSEWLQAAEQDLPGSPATIQAALSGVLGGLTVTTAQKNLFLEAVGINGEPPQGYPRPVKTSDTPGHPGGPEQAAVPNVVGQPQEAAYAILSEAGFHPSGSPVVKGETLYVESQEPRGGAKAAKGAAVTLRSAPRAKAAPPPRFR